jgi:hypothetical protein
MDIGYQEPGGEYEDYAHWNSLIPFTRQNLQLNSLYLFSSAGGHGTSNMLSFCRSCFDNYFFRGFEENVQIVETCSSPIVNIAKILRLQKGSNIGSSNKLFSIIIGGRCFHRL